MEPQRDGSGRPPRAIVVMGVSGSGKSTLAARLAIALDVPFLEGDAFHAPASVAKMRAGQALDDADRRPWLDRLGAALGAAARERGVAVAACSALRRSYRDRLAAAAGLPLLVIMLDADPDALALRLRARADHYMPASLLDSQLRTLERPGEDEHATTLDACLTAEALVRDALAWIGDQAGG